MTPCLTLPSKSDGFYYACKYFRSWYRNRAIEQKPDVTFYYQTSLSHHFSTASCSDGYAVMTLTLWFDVLSDFQTYLAFLSIHAADQLHGFCSFVRVFFGVRVCKCWLESCLLSLFWFKLPGKTLRRIRVWRLTSLSCEVTIMPLTFPAAVLPFAGIWGRFQSNRDLKCSSPFSGWPHNIISHKLSEFCPKVRNLCSHCCSCKGFPQDPLEEFSLLLIYHLTTFKWFSPPLSWFAGLNKL